jgi:hypothetical protein
MMGEVNERVWAESVRLAWLEYWAGEDHRYGRDFAAFMGERFMTDFDVRHVERINKINYVDSGNGAS